MDCNKSSKIKHLNSDGDSSFSGEEPLLPPEPVLGAAECRSDENQRSPGPQSQAEVICKIAEELFRFGRTAKGEPFAVEIAGPNLALMLSETDFKSTLSRLFHKRSSRVPNSSALSDAVSVLKGKALESEPEELPVRITKHEDSVIVDVGDSAGRAIVINIDGWEVIVK